MFRMDPIVRDRRVINPGRWFLILSMALAIVSCGRTLYPITSGSFKSLPSEGTKVIVWGDQLDSVTGTESWLEQRGLVIVPRAAVRNHVKDDGSPAGAKAESNALLKAAKVLGAQEVIFVETSAIAPFPASVSMRAVGVPEGEVLWEGAAWFADGRIGPADAGFDGLACQALATLWGYRPAGYHEIASADMCKILKTAPRGHPVGVHRRLG